MSVAEAAPSNYSILDDFERHVSQEMEADLATVISGWYIVIYITVVSCTDVHD